MTIRSLAALALAAGLWQAPAQAADISGAGATFPFPLYAKWADAYKKQTGIGLNYQSIGSGGGIKQIQSKTVTFGASDMPLKAEDLEKSGLIQFPMIMGGVVPVLNVKGIAPGQLVLDGVTLGRIYLGEIKTWTMPPSSSSIRRPACRRPRSRSSIARTAQARRSSSLTTCRR